MTVASMARPRARRSLTPDLLTALTVAASAELVLLRLFTRTAIHVPAFDQLAAGYHTTSAIARVVYSTAALLLVGVLASLVVYCLRRVETRAVGLLVGVFAMLALLGRVRVLDGATVSIGVVAVVVSLVALAAARQSPRDRAAIVAFGSAFIALGVPVVLGDASHLGIDVTPPRWLFDAGEFLAVGAAVTSPLVLRYRCRRRELVVAAVAGLLVTAALLGPSPARIMLLWNLGLPGALPPIAYGAAAAAVMMLLGEAWRRGRRDVLVAAVLILAGGLGLHSTYQSGLVVAGLAVLAIGPSLMSPDLETRTPPERRRR